MKKSTAPTNIDIKGFLERANTIENELDTLKEDKKELGEEMKANYYLHEAEQLPLFALS